jgi:two-component system, chemotaxis family, protein-glutamate methylesterase/glutaminase
MENANLRSTGVVISILIVDDSLVFRRFLRDIFEERSDFSIVGEAQNGIEALDLILKTTPSVILLDLEMPLMDGMTTLQHLMIHRPTPTIMFSSLSEQGTARAFDTLKNGAVDFIYKDFVFQKDSIEAQSKLLLDKVRRASTLRLKAREPFGTPPTMKCTGTGRTSTQVIFCEDCGSRQVVSYSRSQPMNAISCSQCGDTLDLGGTAVMAEPGNSNISVLAGGEGSFFNLLEIIPRLDPEMGGSILAVIHQESEHIDRFTEYLDAISAMKVLRVREGITVEDGNCYVASGHDFMHLKPFSGQLTLQRLQKSALNCGPFDILMASVSTLHKKRACGVILSGDEMEGDKGIAILIKNGGLPFLLDGEERYCKRMGSNVLDKAGDIASYGSEEIVNKIMALHLRAKTGPVSEQQ